MTAPDSPLALLVGAGVLTAAEANTAPVGFDARVRRDPYALTVPLSDLPPPALRWGWEPERAREFCDWVSGVLHGRFAILLDITAEPFEAPTLLRLRLDGREEVIDWAYLNSARWMGAFCTIVGRLLLPRGMDALELETGDLDTVVLFFRNERAEDVRGVLPVGE